MDEESAGGAAPASAAMISSCQKERLRFLDGKMLCQELLQRRPLPHPLSLLQHRFNFGRKTAPRGTGDHAKLLAAVPSASDLEVAVLSGREEIVPYLAQADPTPDQAPGRAQVMPCQSRRGRPLCRFRRRVECREARRQRRRSGGSAEGRRAKSGARGSAVEARARPGAGRGCTKGSPRQIKRVEVRGGPPRHVKAKGEAAPNGRYAKSGTWMRSV